MVDAREFFEVPGDPVRLAQLRGARHDAREFAERTEQIVLAFVVEERGVEVAFFDAHLVSVT